MSPSFLLGANLPWIRYGTDFGSNKWHPEGGVARCDRLDSLLARVADDGIEAVRWFLLCDGRAGIRFNDDGGAQSLDDFVFADIDAAFASAARQRLRVMFVLFDFGWCQRAEWVNGVQLGGRRHVLQDADSRAMLFENVVCPILERYRAEPTVFSWDVMNEPEWITAGLGTGDSECSISRDQLRDFLREAISRVHDTTVHPVTVGSAGMRWRSFYENLDVDFHQVHWYDGLKGQPPLETPVSELGFRRPLVLGEFPTRESSLSVPEILDAAHAARYAGAFYWSALATDKATDVVMASEGIRQFALAIQRCDGTSTCSDHMSLRSTDSRIV
jgi:hypothetical protein